MLINLKDILDIAEKKHFALPAFNVYNMETVMGIIEAAEATQSPVIVQIYARLFVSGVAYYLAPSVVAAAQRSTIPICFHLDHGTGETEIVRALRCGCTGIMSDYSLLSFQENINATKNIVKLCRNIGVSVEGELGKIGSTKDETSINYTDVQESIQFVTETNISALAVQVGTAHGHYKNIPKINLERIAEIRNNISVPLVLHGGSGIPDDQIKAAIAAGIRKINFGTDICYSFLDKIFETSRELVAIDVFMQEAIKAVKNFAVSKIRLLNAEGKA
ncbi:MAG: class II fructose-bisphosphate aldolase [Planctomycetaceae bacterium]|jgi:ketose-bisphosphate aldolase|nr:class II fructose-bisphosphate aldolase [Planctomycetaceae bacterium]